MIDKKTHPKLIPVEFMDGLKQEIDKFVAKIPQSELRDERRLKHLVEGYEVHYANQWNADYYYLARIAILEHIIRIFFPFPSKTPKITCTIERFV